ncbi:5' nucleotidase, NT5C type [Cellulomonas bogoriensis]|uniref:5'-nucleotidase n=1 Tax=Cellulomonas bogoriensis 69B4 = DSM 16987 TaxID=1386082 RepID=A0A0A0C2M5_9CELL|nr:5'-nucleotidase [Cellulomonas bogoriensis]KGM14436.1 5'-nucleotidase [Cellulomonas bogoriensis 69B4 = DSM 16987]
MRVVPPEFESQRVGATGYRVLGLDLDGVCADYTGGLRAFCMERTGLPASRFPEPRHYDLTRSGWPFSTTQQYLETHRAAVEAGLFRALRPVPGVVECLNELSAAQVHIRIVSHRLFLSGLHEQVVADTAAWLEQWGIPYMSLCFTGLKDSVDATLHVDDAPHMVESFRAVGGRVLVFDQPYNEHLAGPRLTSWIGATDEVLRLFEG